MGPRVLLAIGVLASAIVACTAAGPGCPCGLSYDADPNSSDPFYVGAEHDESVHCFCRCGDDEPERLPPSTSCDGYEGPCQTRAGAIADYACD